MSSMLVDSVEASLQFRPASLAQMTPTPMAAAFAAVKLFGPCTEAYIWLMRTIETPAIGLDRLVTGNSNWFPPIHVVRDPSDLIALPAVLVPRRIGWSRSL